jgi:exopolysaccharide biosynthesis polyprenyl glycosylphosphotransferase
LHDPASGWTVHRPFIFNGGKLMEIKELRVRSRAATLPTGLGTRSTWRRRSETGQPVHDRLRAPVSVRSSPNESWRRLQTVLHIGDGIALFIGFAVPLLLVAEKGPPSAVAAMAEAAAVVAVGLWSMRFHGLWTTQVMSVRSIEISRIVRALVTLSALALVLERKAPTNLRVVNLVFAASIGLVVLVLWRAAYRAFLNAERRRGRFTSRVVVVGTGRQANELTRLFLVHPELGMRVTAVIGAKQEAAASGMADLWRGTYDQSREVLSSLDIDVVVLCSAELDRWLLNDLSAEARALGRTLYVDPGLSGIDFRRVSTTAIGYQPLLEMSSAALSGLQAGVKRAFDILVAGVVAVLAAPVLAVAALLIKLEDGGPVLFRQDRVGRNGVRFEILKFRTMIVDAERRKAGLEARNERNGPLFKMDDRDDPRITRIGRFLRATSLDELPQLLNVLNGTMSLVGPRPALQDEVDNFPAELHARHQVRPGITGLWQVEARDNPSFEAYVRLDLFYVQNWSLPLDLVVLLGTVDHIVLRPLIKRMYRREDERRRAAELVAQSQAAVPAG